MPPPTRDEPILPAADGHAIVLPDPRKRHNKIRENAARIARDVLAPIAARGTAGRVNRDLVRALGDQGLIREVFSLWDYPPARDDISAFDIAMIREGLATHCTEAETAFAMQCLGGINIAAHAKGDLGDKWLGAVVRGEAVAAFAMTEPEHGSDATNLQLQAQHVDGGYRLTGRKTWISNAPDADVYVLFGRTGPGDGAKGISAFLLPGDAPGLSGESIELISNHPIGRLALDDVFLPEDHLLGDEGAGWHYAWATFLRMRPSVGACAVGMAQAALDAAVEHAKHREQFGKPIGSFQGVSHLLAEMATRIEASRALIYEAAWHIEQGVGDREKFASMAKLFATEQAQWVVDAAIQIHGATALEKGHLLEHLYREVRAPRIYEGTSEIQREIIARELYRT
jgi:acyl-CoA dehydrogenase